MILTVISYITLLFFGLRFVIAAINVLFSPVLKSGRPRGNPLVSVLIPARNEEDNLGNILSDLQRQNYRNIEVIVFNDESSDRTKELARAYAAEDKRFRVIDSTGLPSGWLGKSHGCHQLAKHSRGDHLLFLDADVRLEYGLIESALAQMQNHHLHLLSVFPQQELHTWGEKLVVPVMNFILLSLLPMILTRKSTHSSLSAANGQFMLFEKNTYHRIIPHEQVKNEPAEDILIARLYKKAGLKMQCMTGNQTIRCRMYKNLNEAINGFAKNIAQFFGGSLFTAFFYWLIGTFGTCFVLLTQSPAHIISLLVFITGINLFVSVAARQSFRLNLFLSIPRQLILGVIILFAFKNKLQKKTLWKGRNIS